MGLKAAHKVYTLGHKLHTGYTLGKKLGKVGYNLMSTPHSRLVAEQRKTAPASATRHGEPVNNMIYNKSNLGDAQYVPLGVKRIVSMKKSSLEKR